MPPLYFKRRHIIYTRSNRARSFSSALFSIREMYDREMPSFFAISFCVIGLQTETSMSAKKQSVSFSNQTFQTPFKLVQNRKQRLGQTLAALLFQLIGNAVKAFGNTPSNRR